MRRAVAVLLVGLVVGGCGSGARDGSKPTGIASAAAQCAQYPYAGLTCRSPDGRWTLTYEPGHIYVTGRASHKRLLVYRSRDACCDMISWVKPHALLFVDDYRVFRVDVAPGGISSLHRIKIADWSNFVISPDERMIAGWADAGPEDSSTVEVEPSTGGDCFSVPHTAHESDTAVGFTKNGRAVIVARSPFSPNDGVTGPSHLVQYALASLRAPC